ncbi:hypothetical protein THRCLA_11512 [Thraustotheca clavata]|uniref:Uncharacterized protein n=1 Tax=Thraustotheca clavata TaxID=74557 RepID=A0A1V9Y7I4_9STRA|nr:hypothetical protein THRCLA_11512 [Thraustotheca clavata]
MLPAIFTNDNNQSIEAVEVTSNSSVHPIRRKLSSIRRRLSQLGKSKSLDESLQNVPESNTLNYKTENKEDTVEDVQNNGKEDKSVVDIQNEAKRVCSILSGEVKKHLKVLKTIDPMNCALEDVKNTMKEANVWLVQCLSAPTVPNCEDDCIKEAKLNQQFHAERCLLEANELAIKEIKRLSDHACRNTEDEQVNS